VDRFQRAKCAIRAPETYDRVVSIPGWYGRRNWRTVFGYGKYVQNGRSPITISVRVPNRSASSTRKSYIRRDYVELCPWVVRRCCSKANDSNLTTNRCRICNFYDADGVTNFGGTRAHIPLYGNIKRRYRVQTKWPVVVAGLSGGRAGMAYDFENNSNRYAPSGRGDCLLHADLLYTRASTTVQIYIYTHTHGNVYVEV